MPDQSNPDVQALRTATDSVTDTFTYTVLDAGGLTATTTLAIAITGANDAPVSTASIANQEAPAGLDFALPLDANQFRDMTDLRDLILEASNG